MSFGPVGRSERYGVCSDEVRYAKGIFREAHVPAKNESDPIRACGRELCEAIDSSLLEEQEAIP